MLHKAAVGAAEGLGVTHAKILRPTHERDQLIVCAGVGWVPGVVWGEAPGSRLTLTFLGQ